MAIIKVHNLTDTNQFHILTTCMLLRSTLMLSSHFRIGFLIDPLLTGFPSDIFSVSVEVPKQIFIELTL